MRTITFNVPDYVTSADTIATYAFCHIMQQTHGNLVDVVMSRGTDESHRESFEAVCNQIASYLGGAAADGADPYSWVIEYVEAEVGPGFNGDSDDWFMIVTDGQEMNDC